MNLLVEQRGVMIREEALRLGFDEVGFTSAGALDQEARFLDQWLGAGYHAGMDYMARNVEKRNNPSLLVEGAKSVIVLLKNYAQPPHQDLRSGFKIARYAWGRDYHKVIKGRLKKLMTFMQSEVSPDVQGRYFVDSAPVSERALAIRAGLGWRGKNTHLLNRRLGSYVFIATLISNIELPLLVPMKEACGNCTRCIDACPTGALEKPYLLNANKCISYLTIENKAAISPDFKGQLGDWIFGCDICQEVCPWNKKTSPHEEPDFQLREVLRNKTREEWMRMSPEVFEELSQGSPLRRTKLEDLMRNLSFVAQGNDKPF